MKHLSIVFIYVCIFIFMLSCAGGDYGKRVALLFSPTASGLLLCIDVLHRCTRCNVNVLDVFFLFVCFFQKEQLHVFFKGQFFKRLKRVVNWYILIESKHLYPGNSNSDSNSNSFSAPSWKHMEVLSFLQFHTKINKHTIIS